VEKGLTEGFKRLLCTMYNVSHRNKIEVVVVLPDQFRRMRAWRNSTETQHSGHAPRFGLEVKNGSSAEDDAPERHGCGTVKEEVSQILQRVSAGAA